MRRARSPPAGRPQWLMHEAEQALRALPLLAEAHLHACAEPPQQQPWAMRGEAAPG